MSMLLFYGSRCKDSRHESQAIQTGTPPSMPHHTNTCPTWGHHSGCPMDYHQGRWNECDLNHKPILLTLRKHLPVSSDELATSFPRVCLAYPRRHVATRRKPTSTWPKEADSFFRTQSKWNLPFATCSTLKASFACSNSKLLPTHLLYFISIQLRKR